MRTVVDSQQCAHLWAAGTQAHARNSGNSVSFTATVFYSYRTPIARLVKNVVGQTIALIDCNTYSMTTSSKHMPCVHRAVRHLKSYTVPFVTVGYESEQEWNRVHLANVHYLEGRVKFAHDKAQRCSEGYITSWCETIVSSRQNLADYQRDFDLPKSDTVAGQVMVGAVMADRAARKAKRETPAYLAAQTRKAVAAEAERARRAGLTWQERHAEDSAKRHAKSEAQREQYRKEQAERAARAVENQQRWIHDCDQPLNGMYFAKENGSAYLRYSHSRQRVETSQGAVVNVGDAKPALDFIANYVQTLVKFNEPRKDWDNELHHVGAFILRTIFANGDVQIGCHFIDCAELNKVRAALEMPQRIGSLES